MPMALRQPVRATLRRGLGGEMELSSADLVDAAAFMTHALSDSQLAELLGELPGPRTGSLSERLGILQGAFGTRRTNEPAGGAPPTASPSQKEPYAVADSDEKALQFELLYTDGGEFSRDYCCRNLLRKDSSCYSSTKQEGVNVVIKMGDVPYFTLTDVEAVAPSEGYTSPLGQAIVFVSWDRPDVAAVAAFDAVQSRHDYNTVVSQYAQGRANPLVPVEFFDLTDCYHARHHLQIPRSGRYVVIKLLRSQRAGENVDVQYFGFRGWTAPHAFEEGTLM